MRLLIATVILSAAGLLCGCSRSDTSPASTTLSQSSNNTVEALEASIGSITNGQEAFELMVPGELTLKGKPVPQDMAMAIVVDKILGKGLTPAGFEERPGGRLYKYRKE